MTPQKTQNTDKALLIPVRMEVSGLNIYQKIMVKQATRVSVQKKSLNFRLLII